MTDDERMNELFGRALREVDVPPAVPRDEMWSNIQALRSAPRDVAAIGDDDQPDDNRPTDALSLRRDTRQLRRDARTRSGRAWVPWGAAIAATLALGVALGRMTTTMTPATDDVGDVAIESEVPAAYRVAAAQHMERTETLFASLTMRGAADSDELSAWARELLTDTRLLLSSPVVEDAATYTLLEDLELILAQIAGIPKARAKDEVELIQDGINQGDVLLRLRAAAAGPVLAGT